MPRRVRKQSRVVASSAADPLVAAMGKTCTLPTGQSQYQVVGRFVPNEKYGEGHAQCKVYRMKLFAKNKVVARSRFWYFMGRLCRVKKANGQIISISQARHRLRAPVCAPPRPPLPAPAPRCGQGLYAPARVAVQGHRPKEGVGGMGLPRPLRSAHF